MPGSCESEIGPELERLSGRQIGDSLGLCYSPEFIALGNVIRNMLEPDMVLIGESDVRAGDVLERLYAGVCENDPPFRHMNLVNAELTKISVNTYVTMKISYANALADICERLPGAEVDAVTDALGTRHADRARSTSVERSPMEDPASRVTTRLSRCSHAISAPIPRLPRRPTRSTSPRSDRLARVVRSRLNGGNAVGVLGLSYKPDTGVIDESPGVALATPSGTRGLRRERLRPGRPRRRAPRTAGRHLRLLIGCRTLERSDVVVITTPWPEFADLPLDSLDRDREGPVRDRLLGSSPRRPVQRAESTSSGSVGRFEDRVETECGARADDHGPTHRAD